MTTGISVVIPTVGRATVSMLLNALQSAEPCPLPVEVLVVDDRPAGADPLDVPVGEDVRGRFVRSRVVPSRVIRGRSAGPAAARNDGWRAARYGWVAFLDDDVLPDADWFVRLAADIEAAGPEIGGVQGRLRVPRPAGRRPTDWERVTAALADGAWITADMAYRREALAAAGGFDERLPRAFREDAELAFRVLRAGWSLTCGTRTVTHEVRPESRWISIRSQRGNADDALLRRLYGTRWRDRLGIPPGRRPRHAVITVAGAIAIGALAARKRAVAAIAGAVWAAGTAEFAAIRIAPGPRDRREVATMLATSLAIPPVAIAHWLRGWWRWRGARPLAVRAPEPVGASR